MNKPYDTAAIMRQNVADLEMELRRQKERAEAAEAELAKLREHKPVAWRDPTNSDPGQGCTYDQSVMGKWPHIFRQPLYTRPIPAPAPAVPEAWMRFVKLMASPPYETMSHLWCNENKPKVLHYRCRDCGHMWWGGDEPWPEKHADGCRYVMARALLQSAGGAK